MIRFKILILSFFLFFICGCNIQPPPGSLNISYINNTYNNNTYINSTGNESLWTNVSGTATYYDNVNTTGNITTDGYLFSSGEFNKSELYGFGNVRIGAHDKFTHWGTISLETDTTGFGGWNTIWTIDNGGGGIRIYETTPNADQYARFRITNTSVIIGESVASRELDFNITGNFYGENDVFVDGNITLNSNLIQTNGNATINNIYGGMFYHNHTATTLNFAVAGQYYTLFMDNASHLNGFKFNGGFGLSSNLTAEIDGVYKVDYMATGSGQNNHEYYTSIFVNEVNKEHCENHKKMTAGNDIVTMVGICIINLNKDDKITLRTADITGTGNGNYYSSNLNLLRIGN